MAQLSELREVVARRRQAEAQDRGRLSALSEQRTRAQREQQEQQTLADNLAKASALVGRYSTERATQVTSIVESLVTQGLREIFEEDLTLHIRTKVVGQRTDTYFTISNGELETDVLSSRGGGVASVTGFLLRVVLILLNGAPRIVWLDESFAQVSSEYEPRLAQFVGELAEKYHMQFILVTHSPSPVWDETAQTVYRTAIVDGVTQVDKEK